MSRGESLSEFLNGSRSAASIELDALYRRYADQLRLRIARRFGPGPPDPEDAVHAAFTQYAGLDTTNHIGNPEAFLTQSAKNFVLDQRRRLNVRTRHAADAANADTTDDIDAARVLEAKERWAIVEAAIGTLDERRRVVLILNRIHGLSLAEIARRRGCSASLVKIHLAQALVHCEKALRGAEGAR